MLSILRHLFTPTKVNNNRAKILHHKILFSLVVLVLSLSFIFLKVEETKPQVLGISYSISIKRLLDLTNKVRKEKGLTELVLNDKLNKAAQDKAKDMFVKDYWAHFAPDGSTTPWYFIKSRGYEYSYAGENLAKGFTNSDEIIRAWMNSPSHKENILSDKYQDIGFAVGEGKLTGEETTLVVEMFGSTSKENAETPTRVNSSQNEKAVMSEVTKNPSVNILFATKSIALLLLVLIFLGLVFDLFLIRKKNIQRVAGHNFDHMMLVLGIMILIVVLLSGSSIK